MNRREFTKRIAGGLGGAAVLSGTSPQAASAAAAAPRQPNIVFFLSDQHSYKYTGYAGHPLVKTPNLDRIAQQGVTFTSSYCGNPVCAPSRASMITGMYGSDVNSFCNSTPWDGSHATWGALLRDAGYEGLATGKMDLRSDRDLGFEQVRVSHGHQTNPDISSLFRLPVCYKTNERDDVEGSARDERHADEKRTETIAAFIRDRASNPGKPWMAYLGGTAPHPSFIALREYYDHYYPNRADMPNIPPNHLEDLHLMFQELRHFKRIATPIPEERVRRARAAYYGMISEMDEYIGRVWRALEETGQLKNTIFVYSSDHGESLGEHGLWYKNNLYDVATRVPMVIAGAGIPKGVRVDTPVAHVDLIRTFLDWGKAAAPKDLRGHSLVPLMHGSTGDHPGWAYSESHSEGNCTGSFMIRKGDWKYIHFTWYDDLLFNVAEDPGEFQNRIGDPAAKPVLEELRAILHSQVNPEEVTLRAFRAQKRILDDMGSQLGEKELAKRLESRLGTGQARALAKWQMA